MATSKKKAAPAGPEWLSEPVQVLEGLKWLAGSGAMPAQVMIVGDKPTYSDVNRHCVFSDQHSRLFKSMLAGVGLDPTSMYFTNAVKYTPPDNKKIGVTDIKLCAAVLKNEIARVQPKVIVCLGANALKAVAGKQYSMSAARGSIVPLVQEDGTVIQLLPTYNPAYIAYDPTAEAAIRRDVDVLAAHVTGKPVAVDNTDFFVINNVAQLRQFCEGLRTRPCLVAIDCEWHGCTWMHPDRYIRTVQLCWEPGLAAVVEFRGVDGIQIMDNEPEAWQLLKEFFAHPNVGIAGHNVIADGEWLLSYGIDIRDKVVYDTMLAEYIINEAGPFGLDDLTVKYTRMGHYERDVLEFVKANKEACKHGYGPIPRELLLPYAAKDVDATFRSMLAQQHALDPFLQARGNYPSLWRTTLDTQRNIYELEISGLKVDRERLTTMIDRYQKRKDHLRGVLVQMAAAHGLTDFNPSSQDDVKTLLFDKLGLTPIKTTSGRQWVEEWGDEGIDGDDDDDGPNASTDKTTLQILQDAHPIVATLLNYRRLETTCKNQLKHPPEGADASSRGGGIESKIWPDGRLHAHFSQLTNTGRFTHSKPNVANWGKKAEGYLAAAFDCPQSEVPPPVRTIVVPDPGWLIMEGDFQQAELFILAALSGDSVMWDVLTTPGKDMHDLTAMSSFDVRMYDPSNVLVTTEVLVDLAKTKGKSAFKAFQEHLTYVTNKGTRMTRAEWESTFRIGAKSINFGVPYGISAGEVALKIKAETGTSQPLSEIVKDVEDMMDAWKNKTYTQAWAYMCACGDKVLDPGYIVNPWGRYRRFPARINDRDIGRFRRQAQNFPKPNGEVKQGEFTEYLRTQATVSQAPAGAGEGATTNRRVPDGQ